MKEIPSYLVAAVAVAAMVLLMDIADDHIARMTDSPWFGAFAGMVAGIGTFAVLFGLQRSLVSVIRKNPNVAAAGAKDDAEFLTMAAIPVTVVVGLVMLIAAFGYQGTSTAIKIGASIGVLAAMWAVLCVIWKTSLKS